MVFYISMLILAALFQTVTADNYYSMGCDPGWREFKGYCYAFHYEKATWHLALVVCHAYGARLAQVDTKEKSDWITTEVIKDGSEYVWIGGTDTLHEGLWTWQPSGKPIWNFKTWNATQPDNYQGNQHCLQIRKPDNYNWNDDFCSNAVRFICEKRVCLGRPVVVETPEICADQSCDINI